MPTYISKLTLFVLIFFSLYSCIDIIDVDVPTSDPNLVIEASIDWEKDSDGKQQVVKLSMLTPYFDSNDEDPVIGALVKITNVNSGNLYEFVDQNNGEYICNNFEPFLEQEYHLEVQVNGKTYLAKEILKSVEKIHHVEQTTENGNSKDNIEVVIHYKDVANTENYQLVKFLKLGDIVPQFIPIQDKYVDGNELKVYFELSDDEDTDKDEQLMIGDIVDYKLLGISKRYFKYMQILHNQLGNGSSIFGSTPVPLKGNCVNINNSKDIALGYFRLSETHSGSYTIK